MSKKKKHPEHVNHERWLISYADFITLLFAFFVVMFAASQVDRSKTTKMSLAIEAAFSQFSIFKQQAGSLNLMSAKGKVASTQPSVVATEDGQPIFMPPTITSNEEEVVRTSDGPSELNQNVGLPTSADEALARAQQSLMETLRRYKVDEKDMEIGEENRGIIISLRETAIFKPGSAEMDIKSLEVLSGVGRVIASLPNQVRIEGHASNEGEDSSEIANWELSTERSLSVLKWLMSDFDIKSSRFSIVGYGTFRPIDSNATEEGKARNRRVDIVLLSDEAAKMEAPLPTMEKKMSRREFMNKERERNETIQWIRPPAPNITDMPLQ